jgi:redox-regulated HSP33 family molecular chaperone
MKMLSSAILPFVIENEFHGKCILLNSALEENFQHHDNYTNDIKEILSEMSLACCIIGGNFKTTEDNNQTVTIEITPKNSLVSEKIGVFVAELRDSKTIRACVNIINLNKEFTHFTKDEMLNGSTVKITVNLGQYYSNYQASFDFDESIEKTLMNYFTNSIQRDVALKTLTINNSCVYGIIMHPYPSVLYQEKLAKFQAYINTIKISEITEDLSDLLYKILHEHETHVFQEKIINFKCSCSKEKFDQAISSLTNEQKQELAIDNKLEIKCQFCNNCIIYDL